MNVLSQRSSQLKQRSLMFRPTCLVFLSSSVPLVSSPRHICCLFLSFSSSLCVPCVLYPPLLLPALFLTAVPSAECLRCALWQCSLCISDSWVHAFHIPGPFGILRNFENHNKYANPMIWMNVLWNKPPNPSPSKTYGRETSYFIKLICTSGSFTLSINPSTVFTPSSTNCSSLMRGGLDARPDASSHPQPAWPQMLIDSDRPTFYTWASVMSGVSKRL